VNIGRPGDLLKPPGSALSNDVTMSGPNQDDGRAGVAEDSPSVLANLPRTRPQRSSPRRAAARRKSTGAKADGDGATTDARASARGTKTTAKTAARASAEAGRPARSSRAKTTKGAAGKRRKPSAPRRASAQRAAREAVPKQGFESEADRTRGPVDPPGGTELVASAVEIVGELAKSGLSTGERLLKDVFSRLSPS
jgi:hypothetical protein